MKQSHLDRIREVIDVGRLRAMRDKSLYVLQFPEGVNPWVWERDCGIAESKGFPAIAHLILGSSPNVFRYLALTATCTLQ